MALPRFAAMTSGLPSIVFAGALAVGLFLWRTAAAHPAGMSSINRYLGVGCDGPGRIHIRYLLDFAELPAYSELEDLDANHDGVVSPAEQEQFLARRLPPIVGAWALALDDEPVTPHVTESRLEVAPGERGMYVLRIAVEAEGEAPGRVDASATEVHVTVRDLAFVNRPGWRELAAEDSANAMVVSGPTEHSKDALAYGNSRGDAPPRVDHADLTFRLAHGEAPRSHSLDPVPRLSVDPSLTRLAFALKNRSGSRAFAGIAVALATGLGAAHAMSPGHGKALAAATLVGKRARPANALLFGIAVAASHTAVVLVVGALALAIERSLGSDRVMRGLELASSIAVAGLGMVQLTSRWAELSAHSAGLHGHPSSTRTRTRVGRNDRGALGARPVPDRSRRVAVGGSAASSGAWSRLGRGFFAGSRHDADRRRPPRRPRAKPRRPEGLAAGSRCAVPASRVLGVCHRHRDPSLRLRVVLGRRT